MSLVDVSSITRVAKDDLGLQPQPPNPKFKTALAQIYVRSQPYGGSDKSSNGHRYDSIPFANGMISAGMSCQLIHYTHEEHDKFFEVCQGFDAIIVRCNPGQIKADGGSQAKFDDGMRAMRRLGIQVWPSPDVMEFMGAKDALCKVAHLNIGLEDTFAHYSPQEFAAGFKKTMAFQPRVIKQNRGSSGEGIWIIKLKSGNYCKTYGERSCTDDEVLSLMEANDNHAEEHTVAEFIEFCVHGRTDKSGTWTSKGVGKYLEGGKEAGGQLVDQRFCPRIVEGELRYNMVVDSLVGIIHKKPKDGGISAVGGTGSVYTYYGPEEPKFRALTENFLKRDLTQIMPALGLSNEPVPLWWTTDFILASPEGTPSDQEKWIVGEFNCSCVGISKCLAAYCKDDTPKACFSDISPEDLNEAMQYGNLMGQKALFIMDNYPVDVSSISQVAKDNLGLLRQPVKPKFRTALAQIYVRSQPYGGSDKSSNGHRYDSIPFSNGMINAGMSCQLIHYTHEEHDKFFEVCKGFDAIIVRCNPGQIKADGGSQAKFDDGMRAMRRLGIQVWPSPDVMEFMGAKDALCKVAHLNIGLEDTFAHYSPQEFAAGFKKTMAFQPRVIKQNRGSSGEGIWIIKLKSGNYCKTYGERSCTDDEVLSLMEANDNHAEEHTVAEFIEFCVHGRTDKSGTWTSKGVGKYLEGGKAAGGQLVDQRFCPRIVEGELRYNMIADELVGIIHKKPKDGGISAVGGTGSVYTFYGPDEPKFKTLTENFLKRDLPKVMPALGLADEPVPLWWTTDFILASPEGTASDQEKWIVGEFNCSCVGISKCLAAYCKEDTPEACYDDITPYDLHDAMQYGNLMGEKALAILKERGRKLGSRVPGIFKIVFLRHGESDWNVKNIFTGWADVELSAAGKQEAVEAGKMLKENGFKFDIVFTSVLRRAIRTAWTALMESDNFSMPIINTWRLNERHYGALQGLNKAETAAKHGEEQVKIWRRSYDIPPPAIDMSDPRHPANDPLYKHVPRNALPGAESLALTVERVLPFWNDTIAPCVMAGKSVLVAAHGNSLRALVKYLERMPENEVLELNIPTGVPLVYELSPDLKVLKKYYLLDDEAVQKKLEAVANQGKAV